MASLEPVRYGPLSWELPAGYLISGQWKSNGNVMSQGDRHSMEFPSCDWNGWYLINQILNVIQYDN